VIDGVRPELQERLDRILALHDASPNNPIQCESLAQQARALAEDLRPLRLPRWVNKMESIASEQEAKMRKAKYEEQKLNAKGARDASALGESGASKGKARLIHGHPVASRDQRNCVVACGDGSIRALKCEGGVEQWGHQGRRGSEAVGITGGKDFYYVLWSDGSVSALHWSGGEERWRIGGPSSSLPFQDARGSKGNALGIHMPTVDTTLLLSTWSQGKGGDVRAIEAKTGQVKWKLGMEAPPSIVSGEATRSFVLDGEGAMTCIQFASADATPRVLWCFNGDSKEEPADAFEIDDEADSVDHGQRYDGDAGAGSRLERHRARRGETVRDKQGGSCECAVM